MLKLKFKSQFLITIITLCALFSAHRVFAYGDDDYDSQDRPSKLSEQVDQVQESIRAMEMATDAKEDRDTRPRGGSGVKRPVLNTMSKNGLPMGADPALMRKSIKILTSQSKRMTDSEISSLIRTNLEGNRYVGFLANSDKFISFTIGMIKDDNALLYLFELTQDKKTMKMALFAIIGLLVLSYFLKKLFIKKDEFILTRMIKGIFFFVFSTALKFIVLYIIYKDYLDPTLKVFKERVLV